MPFIILSSRLTLAYKILIPVAMLVGLGIYAVLIITQQWLLELHVVAALFGFALWLLFVLAISVRIWHVSYNESFIRIRNYGPWKQIPASEYVMLDAKLPGLYHLRTSNSEYLFLAGYFETLSALFQQSAEPTAIATARRILTEVQP